MILAHNSSVTMHCNLLTDIRIARETGYDGMEIWGSKLYRYLDQGFSIESVREHLGDLRVVGVGYVQDIERQEAGEVDALFQECERMCLTAAALGCDQVELLTGPRHPVVDPNQLGYRGLMGRPWSEIRDLTARNIAALADIAAKHGLKVYLEGLSWTPVHELGQVLEVIDGAERENVGFVVDFWHLWTSGTTPGELAKVDRRLIAGVHFCDSLPKLGDGPWTLAERNVRTGGGQIPLKEWVDAVLSTGYEGWWACELLSPRQWELDPFQTARELRELLSTMVAGRGEGL